jgi:hypothetical protein
MDWGLNCGVYKECSELIIRVLLSEDTKVSAVGAASIFRFEAVRTYWLCLLSVIIL